MAHFDNHCLDCSRPIREDYERCFDCAQEHRQEPLKVEGKLKVETARGYGAKLVGYEGEIVWFPKSQVTYEDGAFWVPRWLAEEKQL